jgi:hypothetical protein
MKPIVNLRILGKRFEQLSNAAFFDRDFHEFVVKTHSAIEHVLSDSGRYPEPILRQFERSLWNVSPFIAGNRSNDAPHETQYVLKKALREWVTAPALISSASHDNLAFYLNHADDLWKFIANALDGFDTGSYSPLVVQIGFPEAFRHRPVFCVPLFHELGHFVDFHYKISELTLLTETLPPVPLGLNIAAWRAIVLNHRREFFADLFAASYCGNASRDSLLSIAPTNPDTATHPSTSSRVAAIDSFLSGASNPHVELVQRSLASRGLASLKSRFALPSISGKFDDALTYRISSTDELYGMFPAAWAYFEAQLTARSASWIDERYTEYDIEKTINDLTEKSLRDFEIRERWASVPSDAH